MSPPIYGKVPDTGDASDTLMKRATDKSTNWRYGPGPIRQKYADMLSVKRYEDISPPRMEYYMQRGWRGDNWDVYSRHSVIERIKMLRFPSIYLTNQQNKNLKALGYRYVTFSKEELTQEKESLEYQSLGTEYSGKVSKGSQEPLYAATRFEVRDILKTSGQALAPELQFVQPGPLKLTGKARIATSSRSSNVSESDKELSSAREDAGSSHSSHSTQTLGASQSARSRESSVSSVNAFQASELKGFQYQRPDNHGMPRPQGAPCTGTDTSGRAFSG